jgi:hypothetical protein
VAGKLVQAARHALEQAQANPARVLAGSREPEQVAMPRQRQCLRCTARVGADADFWALPTCGNADKV